MKMKDLQLLGILVLVTGGIIVLALVRSSGSGKETASSRQSPVVPAPRKQASELDDWLKLTEGPELPKEQAPPAGGGAPGTVEIKGTDALKVTPTGLPRIEDIEKKEPEQIPLKRADQPTTLPAGQPPADTQQIHIVQKGETLSAISRKYYNTANKWKLILDANKNLISKPEELRPNMKLVIPRLDTAQAGTPLVTGQTPALDAQTLTPGAKFHDVQKGDTLWSIAQQVYGDGAQWKKILAANADLLKDPQDLRPGMRLVLP
jgi:nucleoid-associated protein YgaU